MDWGKILAVFVACSIKPGLGGIPTAVFAFKLSFIETLIGGVSGGICGTLVFTYMMDAIQKSWLNFQDKYFPNRNKNKAKFTKKNRFVIRVKKNFGVPGIALVSPLILSIPLGVFLALRFFGDKKKVIAWFSFSVILWTIVLYFLYTTFYSTFSGFFS